jgi:hypothetical protein
MPTQSTNDDKKAGYPRFGESVHDPDLVQFAEIALRRCCEWFGTPRDVHRRLEIVYGYNNQCLNRLWYPAYVIVIDARCPSPLDVKYLIAHEIYHRATMRSGGLRSYAWVDELLAIATGLKIMSLQGDTDYTAAKLAACRSLPQLPLTDVKAYRRPWILGLWRSTSDDASMTATLAVLGSELIKLVGWPAICGLPRSPSWPVWLKSIDDSAQPKAVELLQLNLPGNARK